MVEWKKLGEVCDFQNGFAFKSELFKSEGVPIIRITNITSNNIDMTDCKFFAFDDYKKFNLNPFVVVSGDILLAMSGATTGKIGVYKGNEKAYLNQRVGKFVPHETKLDNRYLYHFLLGETNTLYIMAGGGAQPNLSSNKLMEELRLPIPSINQQENIVNILDTFTSSIDNLKQQVAQRRKQYEYYRDQLLDIEGKEGKNIHAWGEFCEMIKGNGVQKVDFVDEGKGCIHYGQIYTHYGPYTYETNKFVSQEVFDNAKKASKGDIIMTDTSENVEDICKSVAYLGEDEIAVSNHALIIKHKQNPKFLSFSTQTNSFFLQKRKVVVGVKVSGIKPEHLAQIKIYLPSLQEQQRIVSILDTFEASIQNLEAQLSQREKQYEYYRNKLLTFE